MTEVRPGSEPSLEGIHRFFGPMLVTGSLMELGRLSQGGPGTAATTAHGAERIAGPAAQRGGVLSSEQVAVVRAFGRQFAQADGATVRVKATGERFDVVVEGDRGVITTFRNLSQKSLDRLRERYGWREMPR